MFTETDLATFCLLRKKIRDILFAWQEKEHARLRIAGVYGDMKIFLKSCKTRNMKNMKT